MLWELLIDLLGGVLVDRTDHPTAVALFGVILLGVAAGIAWFGFLLGALNTFLPVVGVVGTSGLYCLIVAFRS